MLTTAFVLSTRRFCGCPARRSPAKAVIERPVRDLRDKERPRRHQGQSIHRRPTSPGQGYLSVDRAPSTDSIAQTTFATLPVRRRHLPGPSFSIQIPGHGTRIAADKERQRPPLCHPLLHDQMAQVGLPAGYKLESKRGLRTRLCGPTPPKPTWNWWPRYWRNCRRRTAHLDNLIHGGMIELDMEVWGGLLAE